MHKYRFISLVIGSSLALVACNQSAVQPKTPEATLGLTAPWKNQDIGNPGQPGSASSSGNAYTLKGSGADIWNDKDSLHFAYQIAPKNFKMTARVTAPSKTNDWAKSGLMLRNGLEPNSGNAMIALLAKGRDRFQSRASNGAVTISPADNDSPLQAYLRLERQDNLVIGSSSTDGKTWVERGRVTMTLSANPVVGLALTSHDDAQLSTATFSEVKLETDAPPPPPPPPAPGDRNVIEFAPESEAFGNPERGISENHLFYNTKLKTLASFLDNPGTDGRFTGDPKTTLIRYSTTLDQFRNQDTLGSAYLEHLRGDFQAARERGFKLVLTFSYWSNGPDCAYDQACAIRNRITDVDFDRMIKHIQQLGDEVVRPNADVVAYANAGFIGAWGEWNKGTHNLGNDLGNPATGLSEFGKDGDMTKSKQIFEAVQAMVGPTRMVALRYPDNRQSFYGAPLTAAECYSGSIKARVGGHDDFLGEGADTTYLRQANACVAYGGEGVPNSLSGFASGAQVYDQLRIQNWTNLQPISIDKSDWPAAYERIKRDLGYRYVLKRASMPKETSKTTALTINFSMINEGFANLYNPRPAELILVNNATAEKYTLRAIDDVRRWLPRVGHTNGANLDGQTDLALSIQPSALSNIKAGSYKVYLALPDASSRLVNWRFSIRMAGRYEDKSIFDSKLGANFIGAITVK
jgi:hypothetical protein